MRNARNALVIAAILAGLNGCALFYDNFRPVETGAFYRSAQMTPERLAWMTKKYRIRTVINLRGAHEDQAWYTDEIRVCNENEIKHEDFSWSMARIPDPDSLARFVKLCESAEKPILVHCQAGIHRAGTASAVYLLEEGKDAQAAKGQFGFFFLNAPIGQVVDLYAGSHLPFGKWVVTEYPHVYEQRNAAK